jgi:ribosomal protein L12E/L44/L45/RPP1/RPP2
MWLDIGLGVIFAIEFFTRSGFRWRPVNYTTTRFFDFVAIVPALVLVNHGLVGEGVWVWVILVARFARIVDRFLGDGFVTRNVLALVEGFEEEITDRVMERIIARVQVSVDQARLSHRVAESLQKNKDGVLERIRSATPREGLLPGIARIVGLDTALERAEERAYEAIVKIMDSEEMDRTIRDTINSSFTSLLEEVGKRHWRQHLGIRSSGNKSNIS